eukprot:Pompholyxophrys_punicea_v1_NODE_177_length_2995_cov_22.931633.p2 type:complete len:108 gc:universal NODE_177_length_2995_cov_22.931633:1837-2160(+)
MLSTNSELDAQNFEKFTLETYKKCLEKYNWYAMPSSVHRALCHGGEIVRAFPISVGLLSEEAAESSNKELRRLRKFHACMNSAINTTADVMNARLIPCRTLYLEDSR